MALLAKREVTGRVTGIDICFDTVFDIVIGGWEVGNWDFQS